MHSFYIEGVLFIQTGLRIPYVRDPHLSVP